MSSDSGWGLWLHAIRPLSELAALAEVAEGLGAAAILVADEGTDRDLYLTLAAIAQRTRTALLVGAVTNPYSRHPVATAAAFASLAELAPGRVVAGFGAGGSRVLGPLGRRPARPFTALRECVEVVDALLRGETVEHVGEFEAHGALSWCPGRLPIAIAGRGPRVERFAAECADWILLAGRPIQAMAELVTRLRATARDRSVRRQAAARPELASPAPAWVEGRAAHVPAAIAWNPNLAWTEALVRDVREHLAYMVVDMPAAERAELGVEGSEVSDAVVERYAVVGDRADVVRRLGVLRREVAPELFVFDANDYSVSFVEELAALAAAAGLSGRH
ncbi:MAG TPA: LLM class flavin-dependent oxidoreductase [Chloroflexota bacterium]